MDYLYILVSCKQFHRRLSYGQSDVCSTARYSIAKEQVATREHWQQSLVVVP